MRCVVSDSCNNPAAFVLSRAVSRMRLVPPLDWLEPEIRVHLVMCEPREFVTLTTKDVADAYDPTRRAPLFVRTILPKFETEENAVKWLYYQLRTVLQHELDECFELDGTKPYDPHAP